MPSSSSSTPSSSSKGAFSWLVSACFGRSGAENGSSASDSRKRRGGAANGTASSSSATSAAAGTSNSHLETADVNSNKKGNGKSGGKGGASLHEEAIVALLAEIQDRRETKIPSFNWRMRKQYGTGDAVVGPDGCRRLCDLLMRMTRERRERIAELTVQLKGNGNGLALGEGLSPAPTTTTEGFNSNSYQFGIGGGGGGPSSSQYNGVSDYGGTSSSPNQNPNGKSPTDDEKMRLAEEITKLEASLPHSIKQLDLRAQNISDDGAEALGELLAMDECIEVIILPKNSITSRGIIALATGLAQNRAVLKRLVLGEGNEMDSRGVVALMRAIRTQQTRQSQPNARREGEAGGGVGVGGREAGGGVGGGAYGYDPNQSPRQSSLRAGNAKNEAVSTPTMNPTTEFANTTNGLVELEIGFGPKTQINDDASMALRDTCFSSSSTLRLVRFTPSPKAFTAASLGAILRGLGQNRRLSSLSFNACVDEGTLMGPNGARPFLEPFATGALCRGDSPLRFLEITGIPIGDSGAKVIGDALRVRSVGSGGGGGASMMMNGNMNISLNNGGGVALNCCHLRTLNLTKCSIGPAGFEALGVMLEQNPYLHRVDLSGNLNAKTTAAAKDSEASSDAALAPVDQTKLLLFALVGAYKQRGGGGTPTNGGGNAGGHIRASSVGSNNNNGGGNAVSAATVMSVSGLQELFITDYHVSAESVAALIEAVSKTVIVPPSLSASSTNGGGLQKACQLRTLRYGSCDAPDSMLTRLHNLLQENTEIYNQLVAAQQLKEQQEARERSAPANNGGTPLVEFSGTIVDSNSLRGVGGGSNNNTRGIYGGSGPQQRSVVSFTSGGSNNGQQHYSSGRQNIIVGNNHGYYEQQQQQQDFVGSNPRDRRASATPLNNTGNIMISTGHTTPRVFHAPPTPTLPYNGSDHSHHQHHHVDEGISPAPRDPSVNRNSGGAVSFETSADPELDF